MAKQVTLWDLGHSNRSLKTFLQKLRDKDIEAVVDVRSYPVSRRYPHFSLQPLSEALRKDGVLYFDFGSTLGGRGKSVSDEVFQRSIANVARLAGVMRVCVVCAEGSHLDCHRHSILQPNFERLGLQIEHITYSKDEK